MLKYFDLKKNSLRGKNTFYKIGTVKKVTGNTKCKILKAYYSFPI